MQRWYVLFTKPCKEMQLRQQLNLKGIEIYLPLLPPTRHGRKSPRPLFPRYLFAHLDLACTSPELIRWTPGLVEFVSFGNELATVDDALIQHIQQRLARYSGAESSFKPGQTVRLRPDHPLAALDVVFEKPLSDGARARVLINVLGRLTRCDLSLDDLEPAHLVL